MAVGNPDALGPARPELRVESRPQLRGQVVGTGPAHRVGDRGSVLDAWLVAEPAGPLREQLEPVEVLEGTGQALPPVDARDAGEVRALDEDAAVGRRVH